MQLRRQKIVRCTPLSRDIWLPIIGTIEGQLHIVRNANLEGSGERDVLPPVAGIWVAKSGTIAGQLDILKNAIEQAMNSHTYPHFQERHLVAKSSTTWGQLYIWLLISCLAVVEVSNTLEYE